MTDNYELVGSIRRDLAMIVDYYDEALEPVRRASGSQVKASKEPPLPIGAHILDARRETVVDLTYWARFLLDEVRDVNDQPLSRGPQSLHPDDLAPFVSTWVDWLVTNMAEDAANLSSDASKHANALKQLAAPDRRDWMPIGECPVPVAVDGTSVACGTQVRAYPEKQFIRCPGCGTEDTLSWWMSQIVPEGSDKATATEVIAYVAMRAGEILHHDQIRKWKSLGHIQGHGKDVKGRTLYSSAAVLAYAQSKSKEDVA